MLPPAQAHNSTIAKTHYAIANSYNNTIPPMHLEHFCQRYLQYN